MSLLPVQLSFFGVPNPAVTPTNLLFNVVAGPGALWRYCHDGARRGDLARRLMLGTLPGVVPGAAIRVFALPGPGGPGRRRAVGHRTHPICAPVAVTTPQLLAVIATNPGSRARRVLNDLGVNVADIKRLLHCYINVPRTPSAAAPARDAPARSSRIAAPSAGRPAAMTAASSPGPTCGLLRERRPVRRNPRSTRGHQRDSGPAPIPAP